MTGLHVPDSVSRKWRKFRNRPVDFYADSNIATLRNLGLWGMAAYAAMTSVDTATVAFDRIRTLILGRSLKLTPLSGVKAKGNGWRCSTMASQFSVTLNSRLLPSRWKIVTLELEPGGSQLNPILGTDVGNGYFEGGSIQFPKVREGTARILTAKQLVPAFLRFSPMVGTGDFKLNRLEIKPVSVLGALSFLRNVENRPFSEALKIVKHPDLLPHARMRRVNPAGNCARISWHGRQFPAFARAADGRERKCHYYNLVKWTEVKYNMTADILGIHDNTAADIIESEIQSLHELIFNKLSNGNRNARIVIYTCVFNEYDKLKEPRIKLESARYICFTDNPGLRSDIWEIVVLDDHLENPRRVSRLPKLLPHKYLPDHDFSIYLDGTLRLGNVSGKRLIAECLGEAEIGLYPHHARNCLYEEAAYCVSVGKETADSVTPQLERYEDAGFPRKYGLFENALIVRKNTARVRELNELWWREYSNGSQRDQLSLMYCLWHTGIQANPIPFGASFRKSPYATFEDHTYRPYLPTDEFPAVQSAVADKRQPNPTFSFVSAVYNKEDAIGRYLEAIDRQNWRGRIEVILVDDCSTDGSVGIAQEWRNEWSAREDRELILVRNKENLGNCASRNRGLSMASGAAVCVIDADCVVNRDFVRTHFAALESGADISIGPMGIELGSRNLHELEESLAADPSRRLREMKLQWPEQPDAFLNCVTRNFTIAGSFLAEMTGPMFNEEFSFRKSEDTGFGWEDVDMGATLNRLGARIHFEIDAFTVHLTHPAEVSENIKARGSIRNFRKLLEKNPEIYENYPDWTLLTFGKIETWLNKVGDSENGDLRHLKQSHIIRKRKRQLSY